MVDQHFKMDNLQTVLDLISPGIFMASLDLADAYYAIPVASWDRKYIRLCSKVYPTQEKVRNGLDLVRETRAKSSMSIRQLAVVVGVLTDLMKGM